MSTRHALPSQPSQLLCLSTRVYTRGRAPKPLTLNRHPCRSLHAPVPAPPIPKPTPFVPDVSTFLTLIGRQLSQHASKFPSWDSLFSASSRQLRDMGVEPHRTRRYLLHWRDKFRYGEFGVGGDAKFVGKEDGRVELRVVEAEHGGEVDRRVRSEYWRIRQEADARGRDDASSAQARSLRGNLNRAPGIVPLVVNVPPSEISLPAFAEAKKTEEGHGPNGESTEAKVSRERSPKVEPLGPQALSQVVRVDGAKLKGGHGLRGPYVQSIRGTQGKVGVIRVTEGMWEHRRGHKVDGGERRKAEVRAKARSATRRASRA